MYEKYFPAESKLVPYSELKNHISMVMLNSHPSVGVARPLLPNTVEIGGYHIEDPEPLPEVSICNFISETKRIFNCCKLIFF